MTTERWTVIRRRTIRHNAASGWVAYPPGFQRGNWAPRTRRFDTWDEAIDYVFGQVGCSRGQSAYTRSRQHRQEDE